MKSIFVRCIFILVAGVLMGCETIPQQTDDPEPRPPHQPVDVWLMPLEGFPMFFAKDLEKKLSKDLGLNVRTTSHAGRTKQMYAANNQMIVEPVRNKLYAANNQMIVERVRDELKIPLKRLLNVTPKTICIALVLEDLITEDKDTGYVLASHFHPQRLAVISIVRMNEAFNGKPYDLYLTKLRLYKTAKKAIGILYYRYPLSPNLTSVMYSPIMSLEDLDAIGTNF